MQLEHRHELFTKLILQWSSVDRKQEPGILHRLQKNVYTNLYSPNILNQHRLQKMFDSTSAFHCFLSLR
jgi:hypothetical protein